MPGDYAIPVLAFCNEYSVHQPGQGTAYKLAPYHGSAARAIAAMLWRGTARHMSPQSLEAVAFAIQSGVTYNQMPQDYRQTIDSLVPEYRGVLSGDIFAELDAQYQVIRRLAAMFHRNLPPTADELYAKLGAPGRLVLTAKAQHARLLAIYQSPQHNQIVFAGQGSRLPPNQRRMGRGPSWSPGAPICASKFRAEICRQI